MTTPKLNLISRTALLLLATSSIMFAAGCATEPENNSNSPSTSSSPSTSPSPAGGTGTAPAANVSPAVNPSPAASPSPKAKTGAAK